MGILRTILATENTEFTEKKFDVVGYLPLCSLCSLWLISVSPKMNAEEETADGEMAD